MELERWVSWACKHGASDLHLEAGLPATLRVRGDLRSMGERVQAQALTVLAREILGEARWTDFLSQCGADVSRTANGVRCRINVLRSSRGVGLAIRILSSPVATLKLLNLHPSLSKLIQATHGLVLISGPTGSGKTSTVAALLQEINLNESRHIITLESPIEYAIGPRRSLIRQREVGRDTPSFAQGLFDAMREDPDVLMVGEMREPEVMRLTLNAAETGHLVLATVHSSTVAEALQRIVAAFPAEIQPGICAQIGDSLVGAVAQRLVYRAELGLRVPECEVLVGSTGARALIRQGQFFKLPTILESGAADGCWSLTRYRAWLESRRDWVCPSDVVAEDVGVESADGGRHEDSSVSSPFVDARGRSMRASEATEDGVQVLDSEPEDLSSVLKEIEHRTPQR
jgi:twitching motility protein PilT